MLKSHAGCTASLPRGAAAAALRFLRIPQTLRLATNSELLYLPVYPPRVPSCRRESVVMPNSMQRARPEHKAAARPSSARPVVFQHQPASIQWASTLCRPALPRRRHTCDATVNMAWNAALVAPPSASNAVMSRGSCWFMAIDTRSGTLQGKVMGSCADQQERPQSGRTASAAVTGHEKMTLQRAFRILGSRRYTCATIKRRPLGPPRPQSAAAAHWRHAHQLLAPFCSMLRSRACHNNADSILLSTLKTERMSAAHRLCAVGAARQVAKLSQRPAQRRCCSAVVSARRSQPPQVPGVTLR